MNNRDVENRLRRAVEQSVPDLRDSILSRCEEREGKVIEMKDKRKNKKSSWKRLAAVAAMAALVFGGAGLYVQGSAVDSIIELDVNPSVELSVNKKERVVGAKALNDDAIVILEGMDLKGSDLEVAVNALIGSMLKHGYISELQNSILISVENSDAVRGKVLEERLVKEVNDLLKASSIDGAILSQQLDESTKSAEAMAKELNISEGKAALIQQMVVKDSVLVKEELKDLGVHELNLLVESKNLELDKASSTGKASERSYVGAEKAKEVAFNAVGVKEADVRGLRVEMDLERGNMVYEVEFKVNGVEYDYDVDAVSGQVIHVDQDRDDDWIKPAPVKPVPESGSPAAGNSGSDRISDDQAKSIALEHAGVRASEANGIRAKLDEDDGRWEYDVEFRVGNMEYEYEIDAKSGKILKAEKDRDD
ncbi:MAG: PepSY domain-containing protein [Firmicutes bacterium]|nr:PepSY domain-containing protein [Bacillota bacterium]